MQRKTVIKKVFKKLSAPFLPSPVKRDLVSFSKSLAKLDASAVPEALDEFVKGFALNKEQIGLVLDRLINTYQIHFVSPKHKNKLKEISKKYPSSKMLF